MENQRRFRMIDQFTTFCTLEIRIENESAAGPVFLDFLQQHHADIRQPGFINRGESDAIRVINLACAGFFEPFSRDNKRIITF